MVLCIVFIIRYSKISINFKMRKIMDVFTMEIYIL